MNRKLLFIPLVLFLLLVAALMVQLTRNAGGEDPTMLESALIGKPVPTFRLESLDQPGKTYDQAVLRDGKPILLNVWATWCPTCRAEHQYLNTLAARGVRVVGLNYKDDRAKAVTWLNSLGNPYALSLYDGDGMLGLDLGVYGAPETFLIDGQGIIRYRHAGDMNERVWQQEVLPLYKKYGVRHEADCPAVRRAAELERRRGDRYLSLQLRRAGAAVSRVDRTAALPEMPKQQHCRFQCHHRRRHAHQGVRADDAGAKQAADHRLHGGALR